MKTDPHAPAFSRNADSSWPSISGLTKREYFAALLMQGLNSNPEMSKIHGGLQSNLVSPNLAAIAVVGADDLIEALNK